MFKNKTSTVYLIIWITVATSPLYATPSVEMPTVIKIKGLGPINQALDQTSKALDQVNGAIDKLRQTPHMIGIMTIGIYFSYWGFHRSQITDLSKSWTQVITNCLLIAGGIALTITAPIISSKIHRLTT